MESEELNELYEQRRETAEKFATFFGGEEPDYNDQGYQDLLQKLESIEEQINDFIDDNDN